MFRQRLNEAARLSGRFPLCTAICLSILMGIGAALCLSRVRLDARFRTEGKRATAQVVSRGATAGFHQFEPPLSVMYVFSTADGRAFEGTADVSVMESIEMGRDGRVEIEYLESDPDVNRVAGSHFGFRGRKAVWGAALCGAASALLLALAVALAVGRARAHHATAEGGRSAGGSLSGP